MEQWKDIPGYEGLYQVSSTGKVRSFYKLFFGGLQCEPRPVSIFKNKSGYARVTLRKNRKLRQFSIHRLVGIAFIPNPENKAQINHINGIKDDNRLENLEWCTQSENITHSYKVLGRVCSPERNLKISMANRGKKRVVIGKPVVQLNKEGEAIKIFNSITEASKSSGIPISSIIRLCKGFYKKGRRFNWKYYAEKMPI